ncbi:hypothetical protein SODALDRAFT_4520 [Sodiomyces alkalinus F11]|uniref:Uncharacterized protein n=1 Tax=Sodiomyces alkalinus (strain CBS 110278 / VKM F-3762 / F11) TaxID=1314773 RepID=A0A3N2Q5K4_SODAK|nr:hypothetical protein SODALDRAFT_4520 [Sodiomyces alkalinus F11]ROT41976.1 hypothetical protein SODALDRAFT_4520 [Sodiomyces alkalinus F11]
MPYPTLDEISDFPTTIQTKHLRRSYSYQGSGVRRNLGKIARSIIVAPHQRTHPLYPYSSLNYLRSLPSAPLFSFPFFLVWLPLNFFSFFLPRNLVSLFHGPMVQCYDMVHTSYACLEPPGTTIRHLRHVKPLLSQNTQLACQTRKTKLASTRGVAGFHKKAWLSQKQNTKQRR